MSYRYGTAEKTGGGSYEPIRPKGVSVRLGPLLVLALIVLVGLGLFFYLRETEPFRKAEAFVRSSGEIKAILGDIEDCLPWFPTTIEWKEGRVELNLTMRVKGRMGTGHAKTRFFYVGGSWRLVSVIFVDPRGVSTTLLQEEKPLAKDVPGYDFLLAGHRRFRAGDLQGAVEAYSRAITINPSLEAAYFWRGRAYVKKNNTEAAMNDFQKVVAINPRNAEAYNWLGWLAGKAGKNDECIAYLNRAVTLRPDNPWSYYYRGRCYFQKGDVGKGREDAAVACRLGHREACRVAGEVKR